MVDQPFNRTPLYPLEKPLADDLNQQNSQADRSIRDVMYQLFNQLSGFIGNSLLVVPSSPPALSVVIKAGVGFQVNATDEPSSIAGVAGLNDLSPYKPIVLALDYTVAVPAPPGSNSRIDLIEVSYQRLLDNSQSREFLDVTSGNFNPANVAKTLDFNVDGTLAYYAATATPTTALAYKSGVAGASPSAPATDTGYIALAYVTVATGATTITALNLADKRPLAASGRWLGRQIITATGAYNPSLGATKCRIRMVGGGGGGGGVAGASDAVAVSGGGASGRYLEQYIDNAGIQIPVGFVTIGAAGAAGAAGDNAGGNGGDTAAAIITTIYTAKGGNGSVGSSAHDFWIGAPGIIPAGSSVTDVVAGEQGTMGVGVNNSDIATSIGQGGNGGSNPLGTGGVGTANSAGGQGNGYGAGGGGTSNNIAGNEAGGAGTAGVIIIDEWS